MRLKLKLKSTNKRLPRRRSVLRSILQRPCFVTSSRFVTAFTVLLQNKNTTLIAENGDNLICAQPRISAHSQGPPRAVNRINCWFSLDVTKIRIEKLSILPRFYFHDAVEQLKTSIHTNFLFKRVFGFVIEYA